MSSCVPILSGGLQSCEYDLGVCTILLRRIKSILPRDQRRRVCTPSQLNSTHLLTLSSTVRLLLAITLTSPKYSHQSAKGAIFV